MCMKLKKKSLITDIITVITAYKAGGIPTIIRVITNRRDEIILASIN